MVKQMKGFRMHWQRHILIHFVSSSGMMPLHYFILMYPLNFDPISSSPAVYSPRRFPGMLEPTELSKKLASQGKCSVEAGGVEPLGNV